MGTRKGAVRVRPRAGTIPGALSRLLIPSKVTTSVTHFMRTRNLITDGLLVSDSSVFVCKVDEGVIGDPSPVGAGRLIPFNEHLCSKYLNNPGVCLLCGTGEVDPL